jgi:hypothetical protein
MVCAPKQLELAQRPQNLGAIRDLFGPWSYFIDTTYAVGPRECFDPNHPIGRNDDIAWKIRLSDYARNVFGIFGEVRPEIDAATAISSKASSASAAITITNSNRKNWARCDPVLQIGLS